LEDVYKGLITTMVYMVVSRTCTGGAAVVRKSKEVFAGTATPLLLTVVLSLALVCSRACCCSCCWREGGAAANTSSMTSSHESCISASALIGWPRSAVSFSSTTRPIICSQPNIPNLPVITCLDGWPSSDWSSTHPSHPWIGKAQWSSAKQTARCTSPISMVWQCQLVSGWGLRKWRLWALRGANDPWRGAFSPYTSLETSLRPGSAETPCTGSWPYWKHFYYVPQSMARLKHENTS